MSQQVMFVSSLACTHQRMVTSVAHYAFMISFSAVLSPGAVCAQQTASRQHGGASRRIALDKMPSPTQAQRRIRRRHVRRLATVRT